MAFQEGRLQRKPGAITSPRASQWWLLKSSKAKSRRKSYGICVNAQFTQSSQIRQILSQFLQNVSLFLDCFRNEHADRKPINCLHKFLRTDWSRETYKQNSLLLPRNPM